MDKYWICVNSTMAWLAVGGSVATGLIKISADFLSKKIQKPR